MLLLIVLVLAAVVLAYLAWPTLSGRSRERSLLTRLQALLRLDETLEQAERTLVHTDASLTHVREAVTEFARVLDRLEGSLHHLDTTMARVHDTAERVDQVAQRALPLLVTLEKVATPMTAATRAARLVRRSGSSPDAKRAQPLEDQLLDAELLDEQSLEEPEELDERTAAAYGLTDFGQDETLVIRPVS